MSTSFITDQTPATDGETLTIDNTAGGIAFTASKTSKNRSNGFIARCVRAFVTVETAAIRVQWNGVTVDSTHGHLVQPGENFCVEGEGNVAACRMIRSGASSGTVQVTYYLMQ